MWPNPQFPADLVTFTEKIFNGKLHFLCSVSCEFCYFFPEQLVQNPCITQNIVFKIYLECCYMQHCSSFNIPFSLMWPIVILLPWKHHNSFTSHTQHCIILFDFQLTNTVVCINFYYAYMNHKDQQAPLNICTPVVKLGLI